MDLRQSEKYALHMTNLGWRVDKIQDSRSAGSGQARFKIQIFIRPLGVLGAIAKIQRVEHPLPWEEIEEVLRKNKVWMCKIEPNVQCSMFNVQELGEVKNELRKHGFRQDRWPLLASKTTVVSLGESLNKIKAGFKKDARYCLRQAELRIKNKELRIEKNEFDKFYGCWRRGAKIKRLWIPKEKDFKATVEVFGKDCFCLTVKKVEVLGGVFLLIANKIAYYYYSTSLPEGKKLNVPYLLVWEAMKEAKKRGCKTWDFEGIYDERWPNKEWLGFSHFKKSFGGEEVEYMGSFTKWRFPI